MRIREIAYPVGFLLLVLTIWELVVRIAHVPEYVLPSPTMIATAIGHNTRVLGSNLMITMLEAFVGFCIGNILGFAVAILFASSVVAERAIYPYMIALKTTPVVALAPMLVLWFGTGIASKVVASAIICFFPIVVNGTRGLRAVDNESVDLFRSMAASRSQIFLKLRLPSAMPYVFSGLRVSSSLSVVGAIVGEFVGAQRGLGYLIIVSSYHLETDLMFAATAAAALGGVAFFGLVALIERTIVPWSSDIRAD